MITVKICCGTLCYVMGGAALEDLQERLPAHLHNAVEIQTTTCLDYCETQPERQPPFAEVNGECVPAASIEKIIATIEKIIQAN